MLRRYAVAAALLVALTACSASDSESGASSGGSEARGEAPGAAGGAAGGPGGGAGGAGGAGGRAGGTVVNRRGVPAGAGRQIVFTADLDVRVADVRQAARQAATTVTTAGGMLADEHTKLDDRPEATLTFRVPPDEFHRMLDSLAALGTELDRTVGSKDVTEEYVDNEARLRAARASAERVRALLARATSVSDIVTLENEYGRRAAEVESLTARLRALGSQVELATINVHLHGRSAGAPARRVQPGLVGGLTAGWAAFVASVQVALAVVGAVLPFAVTALLLLVAYRLVRRRWFPPRGTAAPAVDVAEA